MTNFIVGNFICRKNLHTEAIRLYVELLKILNRIYSYVCWFNQEKIFINAVFMEIDECIIVKIVFLDEKVG